MAVRDRSAQPVRSRIPSLGPGRVSHVLAGLGAQLALLAVLAAGVDLGWAGWLTAVAYAVIGNALLTAGVGRAGSWGPADTVTLARAALVGGVTALVADSFARPIPVVDLVTLAAVALVLDGVDGHVARRTGSASSFGARFDMEVDAFLILVLSVFVARFIGGWVVAIGLFRYAFAAAGWMLPWLHSPLPPSMVRKVVAAVQGIVLVVASAGVLPRPLAMVAVGLALVLLGWSFGRDIGWLWGVRPRAATPACSR